VPLAALVYVAITVADEASSSGPEYAASLVAAILGLAGPLLVQGALVEIVRNVREGEPPAHARALLGRAGSRVVSLVGASLVYGIGVVVGLLLLIVPGLLVAARWALMAPAIMLEGRKTFPAKERSGHMVRGKIDNGLGDKTWTTFSAVAASFLLTAAVPGVVILAAGGGWPDWLRILAPNVVAIVTAPFQAHLLSVLYYRLTDPESPTIDPTVWSWPSIWEGPAQVA